MLLVTLSQFFYRFPVRFPVLIWLPWMLYLSGYIVVQYSFLGLQLTLQYLLPILIGIVASGFTYTPEKLNWLFKKFIQLCSVIFLMFGYGQLFRGGYTPASAATPMLFSVAFSLLLALFFITKHKQYLIFAFVFFLAPVIDVTRMGILAMLSIFIFHFANRNLLNKVIYAIIGFFLVLLIFNTKGFQEKTFEGKKGKLSDLSFDYYKNESINSSGRKTWQIALEPGLAEKPIWGNGPRADNELLKEITGLKGGEAHNDYMSVRFNYGYVGLGLLFMGFFLSFISIYRRLNFDGNNIYLFLISSCFLTLYFSFFLFMYSDNILKYTIYFPNYFFLIMGIIFSLNEFKENTPKVN